MGVPAGSKGFKADSTKAKEAIQMYHNEVKSKSRLRLGVLLIPIVLLLVLTIPASAITNGELDGEDHPHVVLMVADSNGTMYDGWRCSATMLTPTVVLTAGHCTADDPDPAWGDVTAIRIFTESDVQNGDNSYPLCGGDNCIEAIDWDTHPLYPSAPFFFHDVGVIILPEPGFDSGVFGELPVVDQLDQLKRRRGRQETWFTAVGYGLQRINPVFIEAEKVRMYSEPKLIQINTPGFTGDFSLLLSNNHATGGTCFGDSGGPNFLTDTNIVAGVTSFGLNGNCAGTGGVFRMDRQDVLDFVNGYLP
jgi:hypothetical protein